MDLVDEILLQKWGSSFEKLKQQFCEEKLHDFLLPFALRGEVYEWNLAGKLESRTSHNSYRVSYFRLFYFLSFVLKS